MECVKNNFLTQVFNDPTKGDSLLNLLLTNRFMTSLELVSSSVKVDGTFRSINREMMEFKNWREMKMNIRITTLDFRRANFGLFMDPLGRILWDYCPEGQKSPGNLLDL